MADLEVAAAMVVTPRAGHGAPTAARPAVRPPLADSINRAAAGTGTLAETATAFRRVFERELERLAA
jgi:hypothetical protein